MEENIVPLVDELGNESQFEVIMTFEVEEQMYAILVPTDGGEDEEAYIFRVEEDGEEFSIIPIESDEEYEKVVAAYEEILEEEMED